jgi:ATP-dependent DNA helicase RecQ
MCTNLFRGKEFRRAFLELKTLTAFFPSAPMIAMSGTLTEDQIRLIPKTLGMRGQEVISENPDRPNIKLIKTRKEIDSDSVKRYEAIYSREITALYFDNSYPVTLMYIPLHYAISASSLAMEMCIPPPTDIYNSKFGILFSSQDDNVTREIVSQLNLACPRIKLVFCTSVLGMGFDSYSIARVIHSRPPRHINDYMQETGRAGRQGQQSEAVLHWEPRDIATNVSGMTAQMSEYCRCDDVCLRVKLLSFYGFQPLQSFASSCLCCSFCAKNCDCIKCMKIIAD